MYIKIKVRSQADQPNDYNLSSCSQGQGDLLSGRKQTKRKVDGLHYCLIAFISRLIC
jgi:hypothetical protein